MYNMNLSKLFILLIGLLPLFVISQDVIGCGGFVQTSSELSKTGNQRFDYSGISVKLTTVEDVLKYTTECAPNGYYFLPVYEKGTYIIKIEGPSGWIFDPPQIQVVVDEDNQCRAISPKSKNTNERTEDINFQFTGFTVSGKIVGENCKPDAPNAALGVVISLSTFEDASSNKDRKSILTMNTVADSNGRYNFSNIYPGKYVVKATHPNWTLSKNTIQFTMEWDNVVLSEDFVISGYDVTGNVKSGDEPVQGVNFLLFSKEIKHANCAGSTTLPNIPEQLNKGSPLCATTSDQRGNFAFHNVPCGDYTLVPFYTGENTTFEVVPSEISLTIVGGNYDIPQSFQVVGFSATGRVDIPGSDDIQGVDIYVDGIKKATTDKSGKYKLEQLKAKEYDIVAKKEHIVFKPLDKIRITPNSAVIPDIVAIRYHICGAVDISNPPPNVQLQKERTITLFDESGKKELSKTTTSSSGNFCFEVEPGNYRIIPSIQSNERSAGLSIKPDYVDVKVINKPILNVLFAQERTTIQGTAKCIKKCDAATIVSLMDIQTNHVYIKTNLVPDNDRPLGRFAFESVFPKKYRIVIERDSWCWDKNELIFENDDKKTPLEFVQKGYQLNVESDQNIQLEVKPQDAKNGKSLILDIPSGTSSHCIDQSGVYDIIPRSCYKFASDSYEFDTSKPQPLRLKATHLQVKGIIDVDCSKLSCNSIKVDIKTVDGKIHSASTTVKNKSLEYWYWGNIGDNWEIVPSAPEILFYPRSISYQVTIDDATRCGKNIPTIIGRSGMYIEGTIDPSMAGVHITLTSVDDGNIVQEYTTKEDGKYRFGPLYDDKQYELNALKDGFHLKKSENGFKAYKLGTIIVTVSEKSGHFIPGVLLSLSGDSYRSNNITQADRPFEFTNLLPGQYFLRPILKEYVFDPSSKAISMGEGETQEISLTATRVAYSAYGVVSSLNGDKEKMIAVEAIGPSGEYEETHTDENGQFRLRGLIPNKEYKIYVKNQPSVERASPNFHKVQVGQEDIRGLEFIVFLKSDKLQLTGTVNTSREYLETLQLLLHKYDAGTRTIGEKVSTLSLGPTNFFEFSSLSAGHYAIKIHTTLASHVYHFDTSEHVIELSSNQHVDLPFVVSTRGEDIHEVNNVPTLLFLLGVTLVLCFIYREQLLHFWRSSAFGMRNTQQENNENTWIPKSQQKKQNKGR